MKKLIILSCVLLGLNCNAQTEEEKYLQQLETSVQDDAYGAFLKEVVRFRISEDNLYERYYSENFIAKIADVENSKAVCSLDTSDFEKWVRTHLDETKFTSVEEAINVFINYRKYTAMNAQKHKDLYSQLDVYKEKYGLVIDRDFRSALVQAEMNAYNKLFPKAIAGIE